MYAPTVWLLMRVVGAESSHAPVQIDHMQVGGRLTRTHIANCARVFITVHPCPMVLLS